MECWYIDLSRPLKQWSRANSLTVRQFSTYERILNLLKLSNIHISRLATPLGVKKGFIKGEALRLLRTNSSKENFQNRLEEFHKHLRERGYPRNLITLTLSEIHFENRKEALRQKPSREKTILPFVTQYQPSVPSLKNILMIHWQLIETQPLLIQIYKEPPIISYKRERSLKC